jgi:hypothetical protein
VSQVVDFMGDPRLVLNRAVLVVEATGVGIGVIQDLRAKGVMARGVWLTAGSAETDNAAGLINLPKVDLVTSLVRVFQNGRIKVAKKLEYAQAFKDEIGAFTRKVNRSTASMSFEAASEKVHDDLVNAVGVAIWWGETHAKPMHTSSIEESRKKDRERTEKYDPLMRGEIVQHRPMFRLNRRRP